ncbi:DUF202 domain-containing protein [Marivita sp.]|uniref:YidH family protein n=1 Tax=Marivita sp. TaxID=2003365 RepID=UPI0025BD45E7|nr:DUF202 domain-containing protein [Marivita sp.]
MTDKTDLAERRTNWAEDRTVLANERTFAGWMRTGMACIAIALGLKALFGPVEPTWIAQAVATMFIVVALLIFWAAWRNSHEAQRRMDDHKADGQSSQKMGWISAGLSLGSVATGIMLWLL